jgi:hypothetical protein
MMRGTTMIRLRRLTKSRVEALDSESGVAMLTAILFMIIMAGVVSMILGVVTTQIVPSYTAQKATKTVYSAQAGIQATLAIMRSASKVQTINGIPTVVGDITKLPCTMSATPTDGTVDGNQYSVTIAYYATDPTPHATDSTWLLNNKIACTSGPSSTPKFALISSAGTASQVPVSASIGNRSITAVYQFKISNVNIPGGLITNTGATACLQAATAAANSKIGWVPIASCGQTSTNANLQLWSYTKTWQIALASSQIGGAQGICITGSVPSSPAGTTTVAATLQACVTDSTRWNQLWSWTGAYTWVGELQDISGPNTNPKTPGTNPSQVIGSYLTPGVPDGTSPIGKFLQVSTTVTGTLAPTSLVGAGGAQYSTHQLVNYAEFGRCTDVTNEVIANPYMISYPCKQDPTGGTTYITWNQKWYYCEASDTSSTCVGPPAVQSTAQQIYVYLNDNVSQKYCLTTTTTPNATTGNLYPYFAACATSGTLKQQQLWNRTYNTGTFQTSYWMQDINGKCLGANSSDLFATSPAISKITVSTCTGNDNQKWNAIPTYVGGTVGGYREISGG